MKDLLGNALVWQILLAIILLILPSPVLKKAGDKAGDAIEEVGGEKARDTAYKIVYGFAEGLKSKHHEGDINLVSNGQIDEELDKYKLPVGLEGSGSKARE